ncbi:MAG: rhamnulokinase family protein [Terriglobales bacterium]
MTSSSNSKSETAHVAIDLGAESCRVSLLQRTQKDMSIEIVHRFPNAPIEQEGRLFWDLETICNGVTDGLRACAARTSKGIASVGVDGWAVDYVRLTNNDRAIRKPFCYRDERTVRAEEEVHARISANRLYELTGIQQLRINTLYQLYADGLEGIDPRTPWINLPEFILLYLGGRRVSEYSNATHTSLVSLSSRSWSEEIMNVSGLALEAAPPVVPSGTELGSMRDPLRLLAAFRETRLIAPACHDTASAIAGIPAEGNDWAFISSGTWSLVGTVLETPCVSDTARRLNFSNEGGVGGKTYFLKNVNGMWLLRQCIEHWHSNGQFWTVTQLIEQCESLHPPNYLFDVDDPEFLLPGDMPARINRYCQNHGQMPPVTKAAEMANLIFHSLAARYAQVLRDVSSVTGKRLKRLYIVGGGSNNSYLNSLTARTTGLEVLIGDSESAAVGNCAIQIAALSGDYSPDVGVSSDAVTKWAKAIGKR